MRVLYGLLLATAALAAAVALQAEAQLQNRLPHLILGNDQVVGDSDQPPNCVPPGTIGGCRRIDFNFNQTWDPDPGDTAGLAYTFAFASTPVAYTPADECTFQPATLSQVPGEPGMFFTYAPAIVDPHIAWCDVTVTVTVDDGNSAGCCLPAPNNCCVSDTIRVRVLNGNEPPQFDCTPQDQCQPTALMINLGTNANIDLIEDRGQVISFRADHLTDDKAVASVQVYLDLLDNDDEVVHSIVVPLQKCNRPGIPQCASPVPNYLGCDNLQQPGTACQGQEEDATWWGELPVDTPDLIVGSYSVWARAFDTQNQNDTFPTGKVRLEVEAEEGSCRIPEADGTLATPPCIHLNRNERASNIPGQCFAGEADPHMNVPPLPPQRLSFGLGHGDTLRPIVEGPYPGEADPPVVLSDPNLLLWKVTYQSCVDTDFGPAYGPEVEMEAPYYMALDTLFTTAGCRAASSEAGCDQDVALRAYDRLGAETGVAFHLVTDTSRPTFLVSRPNVTYLGIPFQFNVLVHDRIDTEVSLNIEGFESRTAFTNRSTSDTPTPRGNVSIPNMPWLGLDDCGMEDPRCTVGELNVVRLPRLQYAVRYDIDGLHDDLSDCDYLFDTNSDGVLDTAFDGRAVSVRARLLPTESQGGEYNDYVLDEDGDGLLTPGEPLIPGNATGGVAEANRCVDAFESDAVRAFLNAAPTQVFSYTLTRNTLGEAPYRIQIRDLVFNNHAFPYSVFEHGGNTVNSTLIGSFRTDRAIVDASITGIAVSPGPFLVGDPVWINATVEQHSEQGPVEPHGIMVLQYDTEARIRCAMEVRAAAAAAQTDDMGAEVSEDCLEPGAAAECPELRENTVPTQRLATKCFALLPAEFSGLGPILRLIFSLPAEPQREGCAVPQDVEHQFTVCMQRPDLHEPSDARDQDLRLPFGPGVHQLAGYVFLDPPSVNDTEEIDALLMGQDPNNFRAVPEFEVYLGRVVVGAADDEGHAKGNGKEYHIRADARGLALMKNGAVLLDASGAVKDRFHLTYNQTGTVRYEFSPDDGATILYWEPTARLTVDPSLCGYGPQTTTPCQRAITVVPNTPPAKPPETKGSPDAAAGVFLAVAAAGLVARRRRAE